MPTSTRADIISKKTRRELQEYFVSTSLRIIDGHFGDADIRCDTEFVSSESGERRGRVQQYYASLDFSKYDDVSKFLRVCADVLVNLESCNDPFHADRLRETHERLVKLLERDGFAFRDGKITAIGSLPAVATLREHALRVDAPYVLQQVDRIEHQIEIDPGLAIGTAKELVETVCKTILTDCKVQIDKKMDLPELVKRTREELKLVPDDVPESAKAADTIRRLLGNLGAITQSLAELRNAYGTGHGREARTKGLTPRHARLAAGAACTLARFLFETHQHRTE